MHARWRQFSYGAIGKAASLSPLRQACAAKSSARGVARHSAKRRKPTSGDPRHYLRSLVQAAVGKTGRRFVLELFSGSGGFSRAVKRLDYPVVSLDIDRHVHADLTNSVVRAVVLGWITSREVAAVFSGTPCES